MTLLHRPYDRTGLTLRNRIAMAPMTRSRAIGNVPNALMADYYRQRAGAGLVITEGTAPSPEALGYARIPGLFDEAQRAGWAAIADAVHAGGARLFVQLMHAGRIGHPDNLPRGATLLAPSAVAAAGTIWTDANGPQPHPVPKAMDADDIARVRGAFADSAVLARAAGADGVELHAANGYLLAQFLNPRSNVRTDGYGGSAGNRRRFVLETVDATVGAIGAARVGIRLSPFNPYNDLEAGYDGERDEFLALVDALATRGLAYLHLGGGTVDDALLAEVRALDGHADRQRRLRRGPRRGRARRRPRGPRRVRRALHREPGPARPAATRPAAGGAGPGDLLQCRRPRLHRLARRRLTR